MANWLWKANSEPRVEVEVPDLVKESLLVNLLKSLFNINVSIMFNSPLNECSDNLFLIRETKPNLDNLTLDLIQMSKALDEARRLTMRSSIRVARWIEKELLSATI